jgi:hypothetical protein
MLIEPGMGMLVFGASSGVTGSTELADADE